MNSPIFSRSSVLNNIPVRKLNEILTNIENGSDELSIKSLKKTAIARYAESNIPIEYWFLKMEKDFKGDSRLLDKYKEYTSDMKKSYTQGISICFAGAHGLGKQLSLETELPTPTGFIKLKDLKEGDQLFDENGNICNVTKLHPINLSPEAYQIEFDDGNLVEACADHLWQTFTRENRLKKESPSIKSTKEILNTLFVGGKQKISNHSIKCAAPINYFEKTLPIDPYLFGLWLGDGCSYNSIIETADLTVFDDNNIKYHIVPSSIRNKSKSVAVRVDGLYSALLKINLIARNKKNKIEKYIPNDYLYASYKQRLSLIQGLMDSDGSCNKNGGIEFCTVFPQLAEQVCHLIKSLGIKTKINVNESWLYNKRCKDRYRITFSTKLPVFRLKRKLKNIRIKKSQLSRTEHRFIVNIKPINSVPMRCITVDSPSHLFLTTRSFIATHNTMAATNILKKAAQQNFSALYTTLSDVVTAMTQAPNEDKFIAKRELLLVDFLVLDEFDSRFYSNDNAADLYARTLEGVFRTRSQNKLPTIMCTNSPNVIESFNGSLKASIESLLSGYIKIFPVLGEDFRKKTI